MSDVFIGGSLAIFVITKDCHTIKDSFHGFVNTSFSKCGHKRTLINMRSLKAGSTYLYVN